jgi:hypothetical protein
VADRSLADAEVTAVSTDARVGFAHAATIAHSRLLKQLHDVRRARNAMTYEQPGDIAPAEAEAIIWLGAQHGDLIVE